MYLKKRVLIIYYSFTQQTRILLKKFGAGLEREDIEVQHERLAPVKPYEFPFRTDLKLARAMVRTFFRTRSEIHDISSACFGEWDHIILAGPTWSYHPSGPVLEFLDRFGERVCRGKNVTIFISCRSYWRLHFRFVNKALIKLGAIVTTEPIIYEHPMREPFRFIGLVLQLRGKMIRKEKSWFRKHYPSYGHNKVQLADAYEQGILLGRRLNKM